MAFVKQFGAAFVSFLVLDFIWLGFVMKKFNMSQLAEIGRIKDGNFDVLYGPALLVYIFMSLLVAYFIVPRLDVDATMLKTFFVGATAGFMVYGVYDMTNLAILKNYPVPFAIVDMTWGSFLFGAVAVIVKKMG